MDESQGGQMRFHILEPEHQFLGVISVQETSSGAYQQSMLRHKYI